MQAVSTSPGRAVWMCTLTSSRNPQTSSVSPNSRSLERSAEREIPRLPPRAECRMGTGYRRSQVPRPLRSRLEPLPAFRRPDYSLSGHLESLQRAL
jgi:hypothetical protein